MAERVETTPDAGKANLAAKEREVTLKISNGAGRLVASAEDVPPRIVLNVSVKDFSAFKRNRNPALFVALAHHRNEQVVKIHVGGLDFAAFIYSQTGIKK